MSRRPRVPIDRAWHARAVRRAALFSAVLVCVACGPGEATLVVQVRSDLRPARDFSAVLVTAGATRQYTQATEHRTWGDGVRVAELSGLAPGPLSLDVAALGPAGEVRVSRPVRVELRPGLQVATVLLTTACGGIECPVEGAPERTACVAGRCVEETCVVEAADACGAPECAVDAECAGGSACSRPTCTGGVCFLSPDHAACAAGEVCDVVVGCVPEARGENPFSLPGGGHATLSIHYAGLPAEAFRIDLATENVEPLSAHAYGALGLPNGGASATSLSPNGRWAVFVTEAAGLVRVDLDGAAPVVQFPPGDYYFEDNGTAIADDGRTIVVVDSVGGDMGSILRSMTVTDGALAERAALPRLVPFNGYPTWSGAEVAFACSSDTYYAAGICVTDLDGEAVRELHPPPADLRAVVSGPTVERSGDVLFAQTASGTAATEVFRLPAGGGTPTRVASGSFSDVRPCALPDGRWLVLARAVPPPLTLRVMRADDTMEREIPLDGILTGDAAIVHLSGCGL